MKHFAIRYGTFAACCLLFIALAIAAPNFLSTGNLTNIVKHITFLAVLALGFSIALTTAELDLSFANVCSVASVSVGWLIHNDYPVWMAVGAGLSVGLAAGVLNGVLVTVLKIPSLIATLATASIANGFAFMITQGVAFVGAWNPSFLWLGRGSIGGVPTLVVWLSILMAAALFLLKFTVTGLRMLSVGQAAEAARLAGISVSRMKLLGLTLSGLAAGTAAVLMTSNLASAAPNSAGDFMLMSIAAVLLGMTMFEPGRPNVPGTLCGALTIGILGNGLVLLGAQYYMQDIALGVIMVASVAMSSSFLKRAAFSV
ncbi:ABC transporter permease [Comamonadaceae bacterium G21597-S1]|nr:ABC transporter permease [Comamonadaceae bacterium G21597-S1]